MTVRKAYQTMLLEQKCSEIRVTCNKDCNSCPYFTDEEKAKDVFKFVIDILKAKDPILYLSNDLETLREVMRNNVKDQNQEIS